MSLSGGNSVRVGIVGVGAMGGHHARSLLQNEVPNSTLTAVCDLDPNKLALYPSVKTFKEFSALIESGLIDALLIATPHYSHTPIAIEALQAGLHVLVEKPIAVHKSDAEQMLAAHTNKKLVFAAMFNQRTDPRYRKLRKLIQDGELGAIRRIQWTITDWFRSQAYYDSGGWRATWSGEGGGVLLNQCVHNIDLYQWIFGLPSKVRAICRFGRYHQIEVEDEVTALFEYPDGTTAVFITSTGEAPGTNRLEVAGERGRIVLEHGNIEFIRNETETTEYSHATQEGYAPPPSWKVSIPTGPGRGEQHLGILKNFVQAILAGEPLIAPAEEGLHSVELINAMLLSCLTDSRVDLPISGVEYERHLQELIKNSTFQKKHVQTYSGSKPNYL